MAKTLSRYAIRSNRSSRGNKKVTINGKTFDSIKEAQRYSELRFLEIAGEIRDLKCHVEFELIPAQFEPSTVGKRGGIHRGKCIERACKYIADFTYTTRDGEYVVEDSKGFREEDYRIKRKLMLYLKNIRIKET
jgi:hypothetical protein